MTAYRSRVTLEPRKTTTTSNLMCDHVTQCDATFPGEQGERTPSVRGRARRDGWYCQNPGPGNPALDLCPRHWGAKRIEAAW